MHCFNVFITVVCVSVYNANHLSHLAVDDFVNRHQLELVTIWFAILGVTISDGGALEMEKEMITTRKFIELLTSKWKPHSKPARESGNKRGG